jgi:hypothetical protein
VGFVRRLEKKGAKIQTECFQEMLQQSQNNSNLSKVVNTYSVERGWKREHTPYTENSTAVLCNFAGFCN